MPVHSPQAKHETTSRPAGRLAKHILVKAAVGTALLGAGAQSAEATTETHKSLHHPAAKNHKPHNEKPHNGLNLTKRSTYTFEDGTGYVRSVLSFQAGTRKAVLTGKVVSTEKLPYACPNPMGLGYENKEREPKAIYTQPGSFACIAALGGSQVKDILPFKQVWDVPIEELENVCIEKRPLLLATPPHALGVKLSIAPICRVINPDLDRSL
jgi:hypothetical protein